MVGKYMDVKKIIIYKLKYVIGVSATKILKIKF